MTPLRAVSRDIELALKAPVAELGLPILIESRTGDTASSVRAKQRERLPNVLITTPESLTLLLTRENAAEMFSRLRCVIVDEWHELISSKRGTQTELALARLRRFSPSVRTWGMSATLANLEEAGAAVVGAGAEPVIVRGKMDRPVVVDSILPDDLRRLPWAGHMGLVMLPEVCRELDPASPTLIFTNTRSQAESGGIVTRFLVAKLEWGAGDGACTMGRLIRRSGSGWRGAQERGAADCGGDVFAGLGRGLFTGGAGVPDRVAEGDCASGAAGGAVEPSAAGAVQDYVRADACSWRLFGGRGGAAGAGGGGD